MICMPNGLCEREREGGGGMHGPPIREKRRGSASQLHESRMYANPLFPHKTSL